MEVNRAELLKKYSDGSISAKDVRHLGNMSFGDIIIELARRELPLPRAAEAGRERQIAAARAALFPK